MAKYKFTFQKCMFQTVEVEAKSYDDAEELAYDAIDEFEWNENYYSDAEIIDMDVEEDEDEDEEEEE